MASKAKKQSEPHKDSADSDLNQRFKSHPFLFIGTIVVLVIVIVAFVFVPAMPGMLNGGDQGGNYTFGYYDGIPIAYKPDNYFARILNMIARAYGFSLESDYTQDIQMAVRVWQEAYNRTVAHTAILEEMKALGYAAPAELINLRVARMPDFQEDGKFSITKYRRMDNNQRLALWKDVEEEFIQERYMSDLIGLRVSSREKAFIGNMSSPERSFDMVSFPLSTYPDSELLAYAGSNPAPFRLVHLSRITINSSEREAQQVLKSVQDGVSAFEDAARNQSQDEFKEQGGDMGVKMAFELSSVVPDEAERNTVLALTRGAYSPIVKVPSGWAFFRADEAPYQADMSNSDHVDKVRRYMTEFDRGRMEDWLYARTEEFIALSRESGFDEAAESLGLEKSHFGPQNINYGNNNLFSLLDYQSIPLLAYARTDTNFWRISFTTPIETPSNPFVLGSDMVVLYPLEETVKDETEKGYTAQWYASGWLNNNTDTNIISSFLASKKMEDKFMENFSRILFSAIIP